MNERLYRAALTQTWAIWPQALKAMLAADYNETGAAQRLPSVEGGGVVVLPIYGVISQRQSLWQEIFGGTATDSLAAAISRAISSDRVGAVVLDIDSPGGTVPGVQEAAELIRDASQIKPFAAISNSMMASAAYWLGSQVGPGRLFAAPGSDTGSIGAFRVHQDQSKMLDDIGIKMTLIAQPREKVEGNPFEPLSGEAMQHNLSQVTATYDAFVSAVSRGRRVSEQQVRQRYGRGRVYGAHEAQRMGLVDRVASLPDVIAELASPKQRRGTRTLARRNDPATLAVMLDAWRGGGSPSERALDWRLKKAAQMIRIQRLMLQ